MYSDGGGVHAHIVHVYFDVTSAGWDSELGRGVVLAQSCGLAEICIQISIDSSLLVILVRSIET